MEESDGTREDTEDTTMLLQIEGVMCVIRTLPIVTKLSPVGLRNSHGHGWQLWKETRSSSSSLEETPNGVPILGGAAKTTTGSSCRMS